MPVKRARSIPRLVGRAEGEPGFWKFQYRGREVYVMSDETQIVFRPTVAFGRKAATLDEFPDGIGVPGGTRL